MLRFATWALLLPLLVTVVPVAAPAPGGTKPAFTGLDVVILIDQSGSMWGRTPNDRWGHRIGQTKNIIYRLAEHVEETTFVHRVSVVDFGDEAKAAFPEPLVLRYNPEDPGGALRDARAIVERYVSEKALINTNTPQAMEVGLREFERMAGTEPREGRRRVMLLITDGHPDLPGRASLPDLQRQIEKDAAALGTEGVGIWVVGLNDASNYWNDGDGYFWERVAGTEHARLAETASTNISTVVQEIVNEWLEVGGSRVGREFECPPYLRRIVFNINFGVPRTAVSISDPDGREIPLSSGGSSSAPGTFARFVVDDPRPGTYKINQDSSRSYTNFVETFSPNIKRLSPASATSIESEARIAFQATDSAGRPIEPLPAWPIAAAVTISSPDGATQELPAEFKGEGKFEAKWKPPAVGIYQARLKGLVTLKDGSTFDVFGSDAHAYDERLEVNNSHPYYLRMISPDPAGTLRVAPWQKEAGTEFVLLNSKQERVADPSSVIRDPATWLSLQLIHKSGVPLAAPIPLRPNGAGTFEAAVPVSLNWKAGEGWWSPGQIYLRVLPQPGRMGEDQFLDSVALPVEAESKRVGDDPLTIGAIDVRYSLWVMLAAVAAALVVVALAALFLARRVLPNLALWWIDVSRRRLVQLKLYDGDTDPTGDGAKKYPAGRRRAFNYDREVSVSVNGQNYVATQFRIRRTLSPDDVRAEVEYVWQNDPQQKVYRSIVTKNRVERLKGLPGGGYLLRLEVKP